MCGGGNFYNCARELLGPWLAPVNFLGGIGLLCGPFLIASALRAAPKSQASFLAAHWPRLALLQKVNAWLWLLAYIWAFGTALSFRSCGFACFFALGLPVLAIPTAVGIGVFLFGPSPASHREEGAQ